MSGIDILRNLGLQIPGLWAAFQSIFIFVGLIMVIYGVRLILAMHRPQQYSWGYPFGMLMVGTLLMNFGQWAAILSATATMANNPRDMLEYSSSSSSASHFSVLVSVSLAWIMLIGYVAIARGTYMASQLAKPGASVSPGDIAVRLLFGVICANMFHFSDIIAATLGVTNELRNHI